MIADLVQNKTFGKKKDCSKRVLAYEAAWARLQSEDPGWASDPVDQQFQEALIAWLRFHRAMLIGELIPEALRFLRSNPSTADISAFDHIIVDEYQDLNKAEQALIDLLAGKGKLAIVGDVDQSIYSFRHANPEGIEQFRKQHPSTDDKTLDICHRCPKLVVSIANDLIKKNHNNAPEERLNFKPENHDGQVQIIQWPDVEREIEGVADFVKVLLEERGYAAGDIMILSPRRRLAYRIRDRIKQQGIPIHSFYNEEALASESAQRSFAILTLLTNPYDRVALRWWLGHGSDNFLSGQYRKLRDHCEKSGQEPKDALEEVLKGDLNLKGITGLIKSFEELYVLEQDYADKDVAELVDILLPEHDDELTTLREVAIHALSDNVTSISELLDSIRNFVTQPEMPKEKDFVRVMSLHKSKGLTCKVAIVVGCIQGLIPYQEDGETPEEIEAFLREQRRLFYVAITRCTDNLVLSSVTHMERKFARMIGLVLPPGQSHLGKTITSQFINELGPTRPAPRPGVDWVNSGFK